MSAYGHALELLQAWQKCWCGKMGLLIADDEKTYCSDHRPEIITTA